MVRGGRPGQQKLASNIDALCYNMNSLECMKWLMSCGLLASQVECRCGRPMILTKKKNYLDKFAWYCQRCDRYITVRSGSFFAKHRRLPLGKYIRIMYTWCKQKTGASIPFKEDHASKRLLVDIHRELKHICVAATLGMGHLKIGGRGVTVEVDESVFARRKYNRGRLMTTRWVLGMVDTSFKPARPIYQVVPNRRAETLVGIITYHVHNGTTIHSDQWRAYRALTGQGFVHQTVNHSMNFVNPLTGVHTNTVESSWKKCKKFMAGRKFRSDGELQSWLDVYIWWTWKAESWCGGPFCCLLNEITKQYLLP